MLYFLDAATFLPPGQRRVAYADYCAATAAPDDTARD